MRDRKWMFSLAGVIALLLLHQRVASPQGSRDLKLRPKASEANGFKVPRGYALVVGIGRYKNLEAQQQLKFAESDADAMYRVLISSQGGGFATENVHRLIGSQATLDNLRAEIEQWLPSVAQPEDRVIVYFAGHGLVYGNQGYLAPWDLDLSRFGESAYPMRSLGNTLTNRVKARWKVLFTDACHSGKINSETSDEGVSARLDALDATQYLSFAATLGKERSFEAADLSTGFGVFTYFLVEGLKGNADNDPCDGWVRAGELIEYVRTQVRLYAKAHKQTQTPHAGGDYDPDMVLSQSNQCGAPLQEPRLTGAAVIEVNMDDVELWVDDQHVGKTSPGTPLRLPGLIEGPHTIRAAKAGYEDDVRRILVAPGQEIGVTIRIRYRRPVKPRALELGAAGEKLLFTGRSAVNPVNIVPVPRSQSVADLRRARTLFTQALHEDPQYSQSAYDLGLVCQLLGDEAASLAAFKAAVRTDPTHVPARVQYAGVLVENGDADAAIREILEALRLEPSNDEAYGLLARAYLDKGAWNNCVQSSDKALGLNPTNAAAHLWRADCLRQLAVQKGAKALFSEASENYRTFLSLTNFGTPIHQWLAYHFIGFHLGGRAHADRKVSYESLRKAGFLGLCITERNVGNPLLARSFCSQAIRYDPLDPIAYFVLGVAELGVFAKIQECSSLNAARSSFVKVLQMNPGLREAKSARHYLEEIDARRPGLAKKGC